MKPVPALLGLLFSLSAHASPQLEILLAPVALQPDPVLWRILEASQRPHDVIEAAAGRESASPAVQALRADPELLQRMAGNPQWLRDLGTAYLADPHAVLATIQVLRQRAASSALQYSDPLIVYGPAPRTVYHVHSWKPQPLHPPPVFHPNGPPSPAVRLQQEQALKFQQYHRVPESQRQPIVRSYDGRHTHSHDHGHRHERRR